MNNPIAKDIRKEEISIIEYELELKLNKDKN